MDNTSRRQFIGSGIAIASSIVGFPSIVQDVSHQTVTVALIGCGGRGRGALRNLLAASRIVGCNVRVAAFCDWFKESAEKTRNDFNMPYAKVCYGARGYREVMAMPEVQAVLLVTPIGFRPIHFKAAVEAGKHVFEEKAVAVDAPGVRMHIEAAREAWANHLTVIAGTQRRHYAAYQTQARALGDGMISPVCSGTVRWNQGARRVHMRAMPKDKLNKDYLVRNWLNFDMLAGDHVVEQHVHNIDIANWYIGRWPKMAVSFGMRARALTGNMYDFFSTEFDYGNDVYIQSQCRQIDGCHNGINEWFRTEENEIVSAPFSVRKNGKIIDLSMCRADSMQGDPYVVEHVDFLKSILGIGPYWNEGEQVAMSTASAIMANMSAKTGQPVKMSDLLTNRNSKFYDLQLKPTAVEFENDGDVEMPEYADDQFMIPGKVSLPKIDDSVVDGAWMPSRPTSGR